ncbi:MAG TPA: hypothetical protein VGI39_26745 [Polyangiaceae bacterium]|jgi:hypothetical protein
MSRRHCSRLSVVSEEGAALAEETASAAGPRAGSSAAGDVEGPDEHADAIAASEKRKMGCARSEFMNERLLIDEKRE